MSMSSTCMFVVLLSVHTLFSSLLASAVVTGHHKLALRLLHRDSIPELSRLSDSESDDDITAPVLPMGDGSIFLVNISIGEPPVSQLMAMDTGSQLTWIQCRDCDNCGNAFNPRRSSTFDTVSSFSPECLRYKYGPQSQEVCTFHFNYQDQSSSSGILGLEKFTFLTSTGGTMELPDVVFGCANTTSGTVKVLDGILALEAPDHYCLAARTGNRFSYCIGNINDPGYMYNQLILGDGAVLEGNSTPMQIKDSHYVVTIEGISVGETRLLINQSELYKNIIVDSGTTYIELKGSAYQPLIAEVMKLMDGVLTRVIVRNAENQVCYMGNFERDLKGFPVVTLHLAEGTDIDLDGDAFFQRTKDGLAFCVAVVEAKENIIGVKAQQYYNVGYDLDAMRISFQRIDCELLED